MNPSFTPEQLNEIDEHILACHILAAIMSIRKYSGVGISDAIGIHIDRYEQLRLTHLTDFKCTHEEYWREVYS